MTAVLRDVLGLLLVTSLASIVAYVVIFFAAAAWTMIVSPRHDPIADELDRFLEEIVRVATLTTGRSDPVIGHENNSDDKEDPSLNSVIKSGHLTRTGLHRDSTVPTGSMGIPPTNIAVKPRMTLRRHSGNVRR